MIFVLLTQKKPSPPPARPAAPTYLPRSTTGPSVQRKWQKLKSFSPATDLNLDVLPHHVETHLLHPLKIPPKCRKYLRLENILSSVLLDRGEKNKRVANKGEKEIFALSLLHKEE